MTTGFPEADAVSDFDRQRRRQALARIAARLRSEPDDVSETLPFDPVVSALGRRGERDLGVQTIPIGSVVGTVDRRPDSFDRSFRPRSPELRARWERIAAARRRGIALPPIDVYRVGQIHFVKDGHHRVSVARALGETTIEARVREVSTAVEAEQDLHLHDLALKRHERMFHERIPLPPALRARIVFSDEWRYAQLAAFIEAWGYRASHAREKLLTREETALAWFARVRAGHRACCGTRASAARAPRRSATCASRCCATCSSTRTTGRTTSSSACSARCARRARGRHDGPRHPQGDALARPRRGVRRRRRAAPARPRRAARAPRPPRPTPAGPSPARARARTRARRSPRRPRRSR